MAAGSRNSWLAVLCAGIVAGVLATLVQVLLWLVFTDDFMALLLRDARLTAALVLGQKVLPPPRWVRCRHHVHSHAHSLCAFDYLRCLAGAAGCPAHAYPVPAGGCRFRRRSLSGQPVWLYCDFSVVCASAGLDHPGCPSRIRIKRHGGLSVWCAIPTRRALSRRASPSPPCCMTAS